jgi:hypothetical protein
VAGRLHFGESESKEAHDARQNGHYPGSRVTVFLLQITEQEIRRMKRRLTLLTLTTLAAVAFIGNGPVVVRAATANRAAGASAGMMRRPVDNGSSAVGPPLPQLRSVRTRRVPQHPARRHKAGAQSEVLYRCIILLTLFLETDAEPR